MLGYIYDTQS